MLSSRIRSAPDASAASTSAVLRASTSTGRSGCAARARRDRLLEPAGEGDVVLLDQDRVVEAHPVVDARRPRGPRPSRARAGPGVVLRVSRIVAPPASLAAAATKRGGQGRDAGEVAEQVERDALAGEQRPRGPVDRRRPRAAPRRATRPRRRARSSSPAPAWRKASAATSRPKIDAGLLLDDPRARRARRRDRWPRWSRRRRRGPRRARARRAPPALARPSVRACRALQQVLADEAVEVAVEDALGVARLVARCGGP